MTDTNSSAQASTFPDRLSQAVIHVAAIALLGLVLVQGWQVIARYVLNNSPSWTEPVTLLLLSTAMSLGAATGVHTDRHFRFTLLAERLDAPARRAVELLVAVVMAVIGAVIAIWAGLLFVDGMHIKAAGAPLPQSINYLPLCIGGALMVLFSLCRLRQAPVVNTVEE